MSMSFFVGLVTCVLRVYLSTGTQMIPVNKSKARHRRLRALPHNRRLHDSTR